MLFKKNAVDLLSPYFSVYFVNHRHDANGAHCLPSSPVTQQPFILHLTVIPFSICPNLMFCNIADSSKEV